MAIGFGIIGCGMIANFHSKAIEDVRGAKLVACFDTFPAAADRLAKETGCRAYHDLDEMLADPEVDVVTIGTPSGAHMEPAVAAARAGKHVIVEKPLEINLRRCDKIINECEKAGVVLSTIFPSRFHASSVEIKKAIDQGRFGQLVGGDAYVKWYRTQEYYDSGAWRGTWELGRGRRLDESGHPQCRPAAVADGARSPKSVPRPRCSPMSESPSRTTPSPHCDSRTGPWA